MLNAFAKSAAVLHACKGRYGFACPECRNQQSWATTVRNGACMLCGATTVLYARRVTLDPTGPRPRLVTARVRAYRNPLRIPEGGCFLALPSKHFRRLLSGPDANRIERAVRELQRLTSIGLRSASPARLRVADKAADLLKRVKGLQK